MRFIAYFLFVILSGTTLVASTPLDQKISEMKKGDATLQKKALGFQKADDHYKKLVKKSSIHFFRLKNEGDFLLTKKQRPKYFQAIFRDKMSRFSVTKRYYEYKKSANGEDFWVDFANCKLGGGAFSHGFVQEEIMVLEMPDFAYFLASQKNPVFVRKGSTKPSRVMQASPAPCLLKGLHRTVSVDTNSVYGSGIKSVSTARFLSAITPLPHYQKVSVLAMAAPKLSSASIKKQTNRNTVRDLFNTIMAGFTLAKQETAPGVQTVIHSGKIGCGVFHNNPALVYLLQRLAAKHLGVDLVLHGYGAHDQAQLEKLFKTLYPQLRAKKLTDCLGIIAKAM